MHNSPTHNYSTPQFSCPTILHHNSSPHNSPGILRPHNSPTHNYLTPFIEAHNFPTTTTIQPHNSPPTIRQSLTHNSSSTLLHICFAFPTFECCYQAAAGSRFAHQHCYPASKKIWAEIENNRSESILFIFQSGIICTHFSCCKLFRLGYNNRLFPLSKVAFKKWLLCVQISSTAVREKFVKHCLPASQSA